MQLVVLSLVALGGISPLPANEIEGAESQIRRLVNRYCVSCHGVSNSEAGLKLAGSESEPLPSSLRGMESLEKIAKRVRSQTMPPPDEAEPLADADRQLLLGWIDTKIDQALGSETRPGRVTIRRLTRVDYRNTVRDLLGVEIDVSGFPSDDVAHGFDNLADVISLPPLLMERYAESAEAVAAQWYEARIASDPTLLPSETAPPRPLAVQILLPLQEHAFRRPTTELERHHLLTFFDRCQEAGYSYEETMQACVMRLLVSPAFLFRIEQDGPIGQNRKLDGFELATRLSYFLWSSMPDDQLRDLAQSGELQKEQVLAEQVERMLKDEKVRHGLVENFAGQWLQTRRLAAIRPDEDIYPKFNDNLLQAMEAETLRLFETIVRDNRPITELLDADYTFVNQALAEHYGIEGVKGTDLQRVSLQGTPRRGVLTHASVLAINAHPTRTSPVLRGKWIMDAILGTPPPPPPADVAELDAVQIEGPLRVRLEAHRANPRCASCHRQMDALGLAFENYDAIGAWRTEDGKTPVDPSGELADGGSFNNATELIELLARQHTDEFRENVAEKLLVYALGRTLTMYDRTPLRKIVSRLRESNDHFASLATAIVSSDPFRLRHNPGRIGVEGLSEQFVFDLKGNPDQQSVLTLRRNPHAAASAEPPEASFQLHTLKPLLNVGTLSAASVKVGEAQGGPASNQPYRYQISAPLDEPIYLSFLEGMISPQQYSDDFLKPIQFVPESDTSRVERVASSSHRWNGPLLGPAHIRPGSLVSVDFDVRLVAKDQDTVQVFLATAGAQNTSMFENAGGFTVSGEGTHRLTQICRRNANMLDAWNDAIDLVIRTRTQTVVGNVSPLHVVRPQLGLSDPSPIRLNPVAPGEETLSEERRVYNAQKTVFTDSKEKPWTTVLYGAAVLTQHESREYIFDTDHTGLLLMGEHADQFELVGANMADGGKRLKLIGSDEVPGLAGGPEPEAEAFRVRFRGTPKQGTYRAVVRIVTQAGNLGTESTGQPDEPMKHLHYVDIPVEAMVK